MARVRVAWRPGPGPQFPTPFDWPLPHIYAGRPGGEPHDQRVWDTCPAAYIYRVKQITLGIVEDEQMVMDSLSMLFSDLPDIRLACMSSSMESFLDQPACAGLDIMLLDIQLPGMSGIEGIRPIKERMPDVEIIILTTHEDEDVIFKALYAGAAAYVSKRSPIQSVLEAVRTVHRGGSYMSPVIARKVFEYFAPRKKEDEALTPRQRQIVQAIVDGDSYKMIADKFGITTNTVADHIRTIYKRLQIHSKSELITKSFKGEI